MAANSMGGNIRNGIKSVNNFDRKYGHVLRLIERVDGDGLKTQNNGEINVMEGISEIRVQIEKSI
jgi:hypothetical protein